MVRSLLSLVFVMGVVGCSPIRYSHTIDATANFAQLPTYQFVPDASGKASVLIHPTVKTQIEKAMNARLDELGYRKAFPQAPSFEVSYRVESAWDPRLTPEEIRQRLGFSGSHFPDADPHARDYQILSLVVEMTDPKERKILWTGRADRIDYSPGGSGIQLIEVAEKLLEQFPPAQRLTTIQ